MRISDWSSDVCSSDLEWGRFGVRVNCIAPAGLSPAHSAQEEANPEFGRRLRKAIALGYVGDPEEDIGGAVLMLCSDESRYITGMTIFGWRASSHSACAVRSFGVGRTAQQFQPDPCTCHRAVWSELISFSCSGYFVAKQSRSKRRRSLPSPCQGDQGQRSEEHTSELQSLMRTSYAVFCFKKKKSN